MMISYGSLYQSIVPKIFKQYNHTETAFEKFAFHYIKFPFIPFAGCLISGVILADPTLSLAKQNNGDILRKVAILILLCFNSLFIYISAVFAYRYSAHKKAFRTTFASILIFTIAVLYNIVITYNAEVGERIWPAYVFAPLPELVSFAILSGDLQTTFLGRTTVDEMDEVATPPEKSEV
ncbi:hypothetical protein EDD21DRAFT_391523 [Dissophora ornata]|nr:hypothetical protein EDD21DRAFT_391523 [Dissophora ornata]